MKARTILTVVAAFVLAATLVTGEPAAAAGPRFPVMNTSEQPPDGVWFRNSGSNGDTDRVTGHGVYAGDVVEEQCFIWGDPIGAYANRLWYFVANITRPTVPGSGAANTGYLNAHFINDGTNANQVVAGVPACGATPAPIGIYASPYERGDSTHALHYTQNTAYLGISDWNRSTSQTDCASNPNTFYDIAKSAANGRPITWMASWSKSRYTPLYYLSKATPAERQALTYITMIDPGDYNAMAACGNSGTGHPFDAGNELARWLKDNPQARLVVIDGNYTHGADPTNAGDHTDDGSKGIQNVLFNDVRNQGAPRANVGVCKYYLKHDPDSWRDSEYYIEHQITTTCPRLNTYNNPITPLWHP